MNFQTASLKTEAANITQPEYFIYAKKLLAEDVLVRPSRKKNNSAHTFSSSQNKLKL